MPRANRHFLPGYIWHITHRVTKKFVQNVPIVQWFGRLTMTGSIIRSFLR
jgi:hypothetical protein